MLIISVQDNGAGMAMDLLTQVFDPDRDRSEKEPDGDDGLGIGLPLVKTW